MNEKKSKTQLTYSPAKKFVIGTGENKRYGVPLRKGQQPPKPIVFNIAEHILIPLAEAYEDIIVNAYPAQRLIFAIVKLDQALRRCHFKMAKRFFEYHKSPAFAHAFAKTVEGPVIELNKFHYSMRTVENTGRVVVGLDPDKWSEDQISEYSEIVDSIEEAADYLRQLAWMIGGGSQKTYTPGPKKRTYPKGMENLGEKKIDLSQYIQDKGYRLTERQRDCFSLRVEYDKSFEEIGARLGIKRQTAEEHYLAAVRKIDHMRTNQKGH